MTKESDKSVLRWGGLASIGGGLLFILVFAWVIIFAGPEPAGLAGPITRFPEIKAVRTVENGLYLAVLVLWVPVYLALYLTSAECRQFRAVADVFVPVTGLRGRRSKPVDTRHASGCSTFVG